MPNHEQNILGVPFTPCSCKPRLVTPPPTPHPAPHGGAEGTKKFDFDNPLDCWKELFWEKNYIEITSTSKSTKTRYFSKILEKYLDRFFWAAIPQRRYQNRPGFAGELHLVLPNSNYSLQFSIMNFLSCGCATPHNLSLMLELLIIKLAS